MTRRFEPPPRADVYLENAPESGPLVTPVDWCAGDRAVAQYFWTSTDKDETAWTCSEDEVRRVIAFGMKATPVPHGTPFGHGHLTVHVDRLPLAIAMQMLRHRVQSLSGEVDWAPNISQKSLRYVTLQSDVRAHVIPETDWRRQVGRPGRYTYDPIPPGVGARLTARLQTLYDVCLATYDAFLEDGVSPEQARFALPTGALTRLYATASLRNWLNWLVQRNDKHAQEEVQVIARQVEPIVAQVAPITYALWIENGRRII